MIIDGQTGGPGLEQEKDPVKELFPDGLPPYRIDVRLNQGEELGGITSRRGGYQEFYNQKEQYPELFAGGPGTVFTKLYHMMDDFPPRKSGDRPQEPGKVLNVLQVNGIDGVDRSVLLINYPSRLDEFGRTSRTHLMLFVPLKSAADLRVASQKDPSGVMRSVLDTVDPRISQTYAPFAFETVISAETKFSPIGRYDLRPLIKEQKISS